MVPLSTLSNNASYSKLQPTAHTGMPQTLLKLEVFKIVVVPIPFWRVWFGLQQLLHWGKFLWLQGSFGSHRQYKQALCIWLQQSPKLNSYNVQFGVFLYSITICYNNLWQEIKFITSIHAIKKRTLYIAIDDQALWPQFLNSCLSNVALWSIWQKSLKKNCTNPQVWLVCSLSHKHALRERH